MEIKFENYNYNEKEINLELKEASIIGITGENLQSFVQLLQIKELKKGQLLVNGEKITKDTVFDISRKISWLPQDLKIPFFVKTVEDLMIHIIETNRLTMKDAKKKIEDSLKIVGLQPSKYLSTELSYLSESEKSLLRYSLSLLSNPEIIIIEEPFHHLDMKNEKKISMLFQRLKEQFKKTIIIISKNPNTLYQYAEEMIMIKNDNILVSGPTKDIYLRVDYLKKNKFDIPDIVKFTYLAKKQKNVKIDYHKDVRDIIKDIYKHV